jgi:predicted transcriptional regulator
MPANRPNKETTTQRELDAWDLRCRGMTHHRIARKLGITRRAVGQILDRIEARELKRLAASVERQKVTQTGQLEHLIDESMTAWRRSKQPRRRAVRKTTEGAAKGDDDGGGSDTVEQTEAIDQTGDPRHLHTAMAAMDRLRDLWGLNVVAATQEAAASVCQITQKMRERVGRFEARKAAEAQSGDPGGPGPGSGDGAGVLRDGPREVQRNDPGFRAVLVETSGDGPVPGPSSHDGREDGERRG